MGAFRARACAVVRGGDAARSGDVGGNRFSHQDGRPGGVEALYVLDASALEGGLWQPNDPRYVCPVLMHLVDGRWLVRNLGGSESDPATTT